MASTKGYRVYVKCTIKKPNDEIPTLMGIYIDVAAMTIEQAIPEARKYLDLLKLQHSTGHILSLEFTNISST